MGIFRRFRRSGEDPMGETPLTLAEADRIIIAKRVAAGTIMGWVTAEEANELRKIHKQDLQKIADLTVIPPINDAEIPRA